MDFGGHSGGPLESTMLSKVEVYKAHVHGNYNVFPIIIPQLLRTPSSTASDTIAEMSQYYR